MIVKKYESPTHLNQSVGLPVLPCLDPVCASVQITAHEGRKISGLKPDTCHFGQNYFYISKWSSWWSQLSFIKKALLEPWLK